MRLATMKSLGKNQVVEELGGYTVLSSSIHIVTPRQMFVKRAMDIAGGLVGCLFTGIAAIFLVPAIKIKSPGPAFFSQVRMGKNGRPFKIYKFRSMYMDAEERKKELMKQNNIKDGMMFKMDDDPRIIKGVGHFIRKTSLDEFPQFWNILKGDMSLVGTRPPTMDEWEKYELHHRKRLAIKPGLTGMWQVSGRSDITDFEEVVELDTKYIAEERSKNVMIIGAGEAGRTIVRELQNAKETNSRVRCLIDDNPNKWGRYMEGVPVVGGRDDIFLNVDKYHINQILLAIPTATPHQKRDILNICKETGCELKQLPGVYQLVNGEVSLSKMKKVAVEDLLGRDTIKVNMSEIFQYLKGKRILVTGGGGSIGSELCRQIAGHEPELLVIFDIYENNAYDIEQELKASYPNLNLKVLIGSVRDSKRINWVFETYKPEIVYHAAAHKHVPLMENSPCEAIKNNVVGTYKTAYAAMMNGCQRFVLISTDKAVNPTNIMGASKRLCEMVVQSMNMVSHNGHTDWLPRLGGHRKDTLDALHDNEGQAYVSANHTSKTGTGTEFVAVRFGNVLGSNGSVIPLFKRQIEKGGPVTVTHPDIIRYFMTIPEAVSLVLQAGTYAKGGEIFVLDMGAPVKIDTLARNLIKLSGYTPDVDIKVTYTGLRPGEKLYEEKLMAEEGMEKTPNDLIHIGKPIEMDVQEFFRQLEVLAAYGYANSEKIRDIVAAIVPTYHSADSDLKLHKKVYEELMSEAAVAAEKN